MSLFCFPGAPNRDADFSNKAANFVEHGQKLADTASLVANFGASTADKQLLDQINAAGQEVDTALETKAGRMPVQGSK
jgi:hypothetical protein